MDRDSESAIRREPPEYRRSLQRCQDQPAGPGLHRVFGLSEAATYDIGDTVILV